MKRISAQEYGAFNPVLLDCLRALPDEWQSNTLELRPARPKARKKREEKQAENLLRRVQEEREQYLRLADWTGEIMMHYNIDENRVEFSDQFEKIFGKASVFENASKTLPESGLFMPEDIPDILKNEDRVSSNQPVYCKRLRMKLMDNSIEWFVVYCQTRWDNQKPPKCHEMIGKLVSIALLRDKNETK